MAINKPNNYEETQASGDFTPVELGGHKLIIKEVVEQKTKRGKDMVVVRFDFASSDKQPGYFQTQYDNDIRPEKKWPHQAIQYILTEDQDGNCNRSFKTFTTCVENSNVGFEIKWGNKFCNCLKGKEVGGVFGTVEEEYNGERKMKRRMRWFISIDKVADAPIPAEKYLSGNPPTNVSVGDGFVNVPDGIDEELPFN
ncbi:MAG: hypothetical protein R3Y58_03445 [Eubacteriales bacterium]